MMKKQLPHGLIYRFPFIKWDERSVILKWLESLSPLWEMRFSEHNPPPEGDFQRPLLRPVYWLGNWQFACLNYYHPPEGILHRCIKAEPYPLFLQKIVDRIEFTAKKNLPTSFFPKDWHLNTCLINFYGDKLEDGKWVDRARVGEHKDFEPGPVASLSFGEKAYFQFVNGKSDLKESNIVFSQWLEDSALQIFAGERWKEKTFHRVQRVEAKNNIYLGPKIENFKTRRINFTFRYVPNEHIYDIKSIPENFQKDISSYLEELSRSSEFWRKIVIKS
jgi:hypothetical protein